MKKILTLVLTVLLSLSLLVACTNESSGNEKIVIGVTPEPHETLVNLVVEDLKEQGIEVDVEVFTDYIIPNTSLAEGDLDANFFQHTPYFEDFIEKRDLDLVSIGKVHIEPLALYSNKISSIDELNDGDKIAIANDTVNGGRALLLLEANGLLTLKDGVGVGATENDIVDNPKNLKFTALEAAFLPRALDDVKAAVINGNYALEADLNPLKDGIIIEDGDSPYANIIAIRAGEENEEKFTKLIEALNSEKVKDYILETYEGGVIPAF